MLQDSDQQTKVPHCCDKIQDSEDSITDPQFCEEWQPYNISRLKVSKSKDDSVQSKNERSFDILRIRRFNSSDNVTTYETGSSEFFKKIGSYKHLRSSDYIGNYNQAKVTELNDEEDEVVDEINEPVFVDIPTLVAVLIKPDDNLQESSTQIEEICSDEVQEDSIDANFIESNNEEFQEKIDDIDPDDRRNFVNFRDTLENLEIGEFHQTLSEYSAPNPGIAEKTKSRGKFNKQNSIDLPSSNLSVSRKFGSIEGINKRKEPTSGLQRSHTNLEKHPAPSDRVKKLNNICEIDDFKTNIKSENIWKAIGKVGSKHHLQRKSSNDSDKSLKDFNSGKGYNIGRKPSLESLKRKTSKDSSSSSSKDEQILISSLTRDKLLRRKSSLETQEVAGVVRHHTAIQRVKRAEIVAAVTERLYSSRKHTEEINNMATNNASDMRSPPEGTDVKAPSTSGFAARSKLQEISRKMLLKRRRVNVETQTEAASTLRFKDTASLTDEPKIQDAAVLTDDHANCNKMIADHRLPVLRVKDVATLTDRSRTNILRCKNVESLTNLDFGTYELHLPRNDSGTLSDDIQNNYTENNPFNAEICPVDDSGTLCADRSTNTFRLSSSKDSAVQTIMRQEVIGQQKVTGCNQCYSLAQESSQRALVASSAEKNVISISLPDMISITIESTNGLESRIAVIDGSESTEEKSKLVFTDKESQTDEQMKNETEGSFLKDFSVRSTAIQADGKVFRIENIFQDPRSKSSSDATSDLQMETTMKKSVTFRSSLGTSSVIETKENDNTKIELDKIGCIQNLYKKRPPILSGDLTRAFIARKHSLSSRRPVRRLSRHDLWKNWALPCSVKSSDLKKMVSTSSSAQQDINTELVDNLSLSATQSNEYTLVNKIPEETNQVLSGQLTSNSKDSKNSKYISTKSLLDYDYNFSDDSLDYDKDNVARKSTDYVKTVDLHDRENYENFCPPDVVAHTKKEASKSVQNQGMDSTNAHSLINDDFEDTEVELLKKKLTEILDENPIHDYKPLILGTYVVNSDSEEERKAEMFNLSDSMNKKKVSFSIPSSPEEINDIVTDDKSLTSESNSEIALKSIIKKMKKKKLSITENLDIVRSNVETDDWSLQQKRTESIKSRKVLPASKVNQDSENSEKPLNNKKVELFSENCSEELCSESDGIVSDEDIGSRVVLKRNILEKYLNEAIIFMRNMNSINEYMNATNLLQRYGKRRGRRKNQRGNNLSVDKDYIKFRGRKVSLKDDTDKYLQPNENEIISIDSYEKYLRGIERLEACIDKVGRHNQILRDRYGIDVESAGAKLNLANPSTDSKDAQVTRSLNENTSSFCGTSLPSLSSTRANITEQFSLNEGEKQEAVTKIDKYDLDNKNNNVATEDNLERRIFDQLMDAADFGCDLSKPRHRRFWKRSDFRLQSPTTYSKFRETFRQDARGILNFHEVPVAEDYLDDIRGIESSRRNFSGTVTEQPTGDIESQMYIECKVGPKEFRDRNKLPEKKNSNVLKIQVSSEPTILETKVAYLDCPIDPANLIETDRTFCAEDEYARKSMGSKDSLRIDSMNQRSEGPLSVELKYPGSPRAKFLELLRERRRIVENSRGTNAF